MVINKKVLVCCGTGIATSVQVANKLQRMLRDRGVAATMKECKTANVPAQVETFQPDAIVVTTAINPPDEGVKVYRGTPLLTGVGADELADQIADDLKALNDCATSHHRELGRRDVPRTVRRYQFPACR